MLDLDRLAETVRESHSPEYGIATRTLNVAEPQNTPETKLWNWYYRSGPCPTDAEFVDAIHCLAKEWQKQRAQGLDIVASAVLDSLKDAVEAMGEIV